MKSESLTEQDFGWNVLASTLAHEIRNPLQALRLELDCARRKGSLLQALENIDHNLLRIESVVNRIQKMGHRYELSIQRFDLSQLMESIFTTMRFWLEASGIRLVEQVEWEGQAIIEADKELLEQVLLNFITNAIQAMPNGGELSVCISECERTAQIQVKDSGVGMDEETLRYFGTPFFTTKNNGNGLGIAFCKSIISLHRGRIDVRSQPSVGTSILVEIPKSQSSLESE